jgi:predicted permease
VINGRTFEVIGVAPAGFTGVDLDRVAAWIPLSAAAEGIGGPEWYREWNMRWVQVLGRLRPGVAIPQASADATLAHAQALAARPNAPATTNGEPRAIFGPLLRERGPRQTESAKVATWLAGVSFIVLLIACANVANLLLARAMRRRREIAVRLALGVGRARLVGQLMTESLVLAALGGVAALLLAQWGGGLLRAVLLPDVAWVGGLGDARMVGFTATAVVLSGVLSGLAPVLQATRSDLAGALKAGTREGSYQRSRLRTTLLVAQAALSVVLLVGAGLFVRSLRNVRSLDLGYSADRVLFVDVDMRGLGYTPAEEVGLYERLHERLRTLPGVERASLAASTPFYSSIVPDMIIPPWDSLPTLPSGGPYLNAVSHDYFAVMGTRIARGRGFTEEDRLGAPRVAIVSETMARVMWPGQDALGKCIKLSDSATTPCSEVVGIAPDGHWRDIRREPAMQLYVPLEQKQWTGNLRALFLRPRGDRAVVAQQVRREVQAEAPKLPFVDVRLLQDLVDPEVRPWQLGATMFGVFGGLALLLAAVGLYGTIAYTVTQRTHELGVRVALGAQSTDVIRLVVGQGVRIAVVGIALGAGIALAGGRAVRALLFDISPNDVTVFATVTVVLLLVSVAASLIPAWRAARVDPNIALRAD